MNSLKEKLPALEEWIEKFPFLESFLALIAPLVLLILNDNLLPIMLKVSTPKPLRFSGCSKNMYALTRLFIVQAFATWEGHVSSPVLEASLFVKLCSFTVRRMSGHCLFRLKETKS